MKLNLINVEKICAGIILVALGLKFLHVPLYGIPLILACTALAFTYIKYGLKNWIEEFGGSLSFYLFIGLAFSFSCLAFLYKFMYWPWAGFMNFIAFFLLLTVWMLLKKRKEENFYKTINFRVMVIAPIILICIVIPRDQIIRIQHWDDRSTPN
jgi:hypothetical protein